MILKKVDEFIRRERDFGDWVFYAIIILFILLVAFMILLGVRQHRASEICKELGYGTATAFSIRDGTPSTCSVEMKIDIEAQAPEQ